jgi:hypothetical protein
VEVSAVAYVFEIQRYESKAPGREGIASLHVTMIFRLEEGGWKLVHRQADPLAEPQPLQRSIQEPSSLHTCPVPRSPALAEPFDGGETRSWPNPEKPD